MSTFLQLAPMQSMTDVVFMNNYHRVFGGFDEMMAPYILATGQSLVKSSVLEKKYSKLDDDIKLIPQLLSNDALGFIHYANLLYDMGFEKVNWNLGCPFPFVTKKKRGAGLLSYPDMIKKILNEIIPKIKISLSVKIRLGFDSEDDIIPIIDILNSYPIVETIVHPRTAEQRYEGVANRVFFSEIYDKFNMPVVYNGDIVSVNHISEIEKQHPDIKGFMIGRGAFINPFITNQIKGVEYTYSEKINKYKDLYYSLHSYYKEHTKNDIGFLHRMKELWWYFSQSFEDGESYFVNLRTINSIEIFENTISGIFTNGILKV